MKIQKKMGKIHPKKFAKFEYQKDAIKAKGKSLKIIKIAKISRRPLCQIFLP